MKKIIPIQKENINVLYKKMWLLKFYAKLGFKIYINYENQLFENSKKRHDKEIDEVLKNLDILNTRKKREKYNLIYDYACFYLDNEFQNKKLCDFKKDICICNREKDKNIVSSCCVRNTNNQPCKYFDNNQKICTIKCITCKLYTCPYLRAKGVQYQVNSISYLKYHLSFRQKLICCNRFFKDKEEIIDEFMKFYKLP